MGRKWYGFTSTHQEPASKSSLKQYLNSKITSILLDSLVSSLSEQQINGISEVLCYDNLKRSREDGRKGPDLLDDKSSIPESCLTEQKKKVPTTLAPHCDIAIKEALMRPQVGLKLKVKPMSKQYQVSVLGILKQSLISSADSSSSSVNSYSRSPFFLD